MTLGAGRSGSAYGVHRGAACERTGTPSSQSTTHRATGACSRHGRGGQTPGPGCRPAAPSGPPPGGVRVEGQLRRASPPRTYCRSSTPAPALPSPARPPPPPTPRPPAPAPRLLAPGSLPRPHPRALALASALPGVVRPEGGGGARTGASEGRSRPGPVLAGTGGPPRWRGGCARWPGPWGPGRPREATCGARRQTGAPQLRPSCGGRAATPACWRAARSRQGRYCLLQLLTVSIRVCKPHTRPARAFTRPERAAMLCACLKGRHVKDPAILHRARAHGCKWPASDDPFGANWRGNQRV